MILVVHRLIRLTVEKLEFMTKSWLGKCHNHTGQSLSAVHFSEGSFDCREGYETFMAHNLRAERLQKKPSDCMDISQSLFPEPSTRVSIGAADMQSN